MTIDSDDLLSKIQDMVLKEVGKITKLNSMEIDIDVEFDKYGFDSILLMDFVKQLNQKYSLELMPTIFFEYSTIRTFSEYLMQEHNSIFAQRFSVDMGG